MALLGFDRSRTDAVLMPVLGETCWILTRSQHPDGRGGMAYTYAKGEATICAIAPKSGGEYVGRAGRAQKVEPGERIEDRTDNVVTLPAGTEVDEHDQIEIEGRGLFEVTVLYRRSVEIGRQVEVREIV